MKSLLTVLFAVTAITTNSLAETKASSDKQLQELRQYMQCSQTVAAVGQYLPQDIQKSVKTVQAADHTDIWLMKNDNSNVQVRITNKDEVHSQVVTSMDQPQSSLQPVAPEARTAFVASLIAAYREHLIGQLKAVTPDVMAYAANQPAGFSVARDNFRKAYLSGNHPCDAISEKTFANAFARAEDTVLSGFIQMSQQVTAQRQAANNGK